MKSMKIHDGCPCKVHEICPQSVPMGLLNQDWAKINHDQTLERLDERGGMTVTEILANIYKRSWHDLPTEKAVVTLFHIMTGYKAAIANMKREWPKDICDECKTPNFCKANIDRPCVVNL